MHHAIVLLAVYTECHTINKKLEVRFELSFIILMCINKLKLGLRTFGKDYGSVLNVDENDFFFSQIRKFRPYKDSDSGDWKRSLKN